MLDTIGPAIRDANQPLRFCIDFMRHDMSWFGNWDALVTQNPAALQFCLSFCILACYPISSVPPTGELPNHACVLPTEIAKGESRALHITSHRQKSLHLLTSSFMTADIDQSGLFERVARTASPPKHPNLPLHRSLNRILTTKQSLQRCRPYSQNS